MLQAHSYEEILKRCRQITDGISPKFKPGDRVCLSNECIGVAGEPDNRKVTGTVIGISRLHPEVRYAILWDSFKLFESPTKAARTLRQLSTYKGLGDYIQEGQWAEYELQALPSQELANAARSG